MNLDGKVTNPGELRTQITLQRRTVTTNAGGFQAPAWSNIGSVYCKWVNAHGSEVWSAAAAGAEQPATVFIRYNEELDTTCAVLLNSVRFEIVSIDDIRERHEYMELKVKRMREG